MTRDEEDALVTAFMMPPYSVYGAWNFDYEYPGFFVYRHDSGKRKVYFTPDFEIDGFVDIQVVKDVETDKREFHQEAFTSMDPEELFRIVQPYLSVSLRRAWDPRKESLGATRRVLTDSEHKALISALYQMPYAQHGRWRFSYQDPGFGEVDPSEPGWYAYSHDAGIKTVFFRPDFEEPGVVSIHVTRHHQNPEIFQEAFSSARADDLFEVIEPFLRPGSPRQRRWWDPREG